MPFKVALPFDIKILKSFDPDPEIMQEVGIVLCKMFQQYMSSYIYRALDKVLVQREFYPLF